MPLLRATQGLVIFGVSRARAWRRSEKSGATRVGTANQWPDAPSNPFRMHESDEAAVAGAKNGDREAFRALVERHSRYLFRIVYRLTTHNEDAQDVVQDPWLKAHAQLGRFEARANVRTWLTRIAINCAIDHLRVSRRREPSYDPATFEREPTGGWIEAMDAEPDRQVL